MRPRTKSIRRLRIEESTAFRRLSVEEGGCRGRDNDEDGGSVVDGEEMVGGS